MDWDDLRVFLALARDGTVRGAAQSLGVSHSTVSRRLDAHEKRHGVVLFDRSGPGYRPTGAGEALVAAAEAMEDQVARLADAILDRPLTLAGPVRLAMQETLGTALMARALAAFPALYPDIDLHVMSDRSQTAAAADVLLAYGAQAPADRADAKWLAPLITCAYQARDLADGGQALPWLAAGSSAGGLPGVPSGARVSLRIHGDRQRADTARHGAGRTMLPCFLGDRIPGLARCPGFAPQDTGLGLWLAGPAGPGTTARSRAVMAWVEQAVLAQAELIAGAKPATPSLAPAERPAPPPREPRPAPAAGRTEPAPAAPDTAPPQPARPRLL